jgi:hypothetical protein
MKPRHLFAILAGAALIVWTLASCDILPNTGPVSIAQRISDFQADLNTTDRTNVYNDFHPDMTTQFNALKNPGLVGFNTLFPLPGPSYSLSIVDSSNPSAVIVQVTAGSTDGSGYTVPFYLQLAMATVNTNDWRIVTLADSQTNGSYTVRYN